MKYIFGLIITALLLFTLPGCKKHTPVVYGKVDKTPYPTRECNRQLRRGLELKGKPIAKIVVFKKKRRMYTYDARGKLMHIFRVSLGKNCDKGNKVCAGDYKTPEGSYRIVRKKCDNRLYRSLMISYPNKEDRARARRKGLHPGGYITIHGQPKWNADGRGDNYTLSHDWTEGCMAVPNKAMSQLWASVRNGVKIEIHR